MKKSIIAIIGISLLSFNLNAQNMNTLDSKQQQIVHISAFTAVGDLENLKIALNGGLDAGLTINEIREILVQMYAYTGFPRSLNAINTLIAVLEERKAKGMTDKTGAKPTGFSDKNKYAKGKQTLETLSGRKETELTGANAFAPAIDEFLKEHLFADIFGRGVLTYEQRELATISALSALGNVEPQLGGHKLIGKNVGLTDGQIDELSEIVGNHFLQSLFPKGEKAGNEYFVGTAWVTPLVSDTNHHCAVYDVKFEAGCRNSWHSHGIGQILLCTDGKGWYQERGKPARPLRKGDVVNIPANVVHWHGAAADSDFTHIGISPQADKNKTQWLEPVSEEEYNNLK
jgi:quercetin dioxygenase-like cupin family protein/alkylhydroperoxidase/carboxymuconolactone decarboxylase family protein YurZ